MNEQKAITPKLSKAEIWFFCIALLPNENYLPAIILVDISYSLLGQSSQKYLRNGSYVSFL
jgi:hypothetical protein